MRITLLSIVYTLIRRLTLSLVYLSQAVFRQKRDMEPAVLIGDMGIKWVRRCAPRALFQSPVYPNLERRLYDLTFPSPLTFSAFKHEPDCIKLWLDLGMGGGCLKTILPQMRPGNTRPRIQEREGGDLVNAMGFPGDGIPVFLKEVEQHILPFVSQPIGFSLGGGSIEEYRIAFRSLNDFVKRFPEKQLYYEMNISCPNVKNGRKLTKHPELLKELLLEIRSETDRVVGVKLSPDQTDEMLLTFAKLIYSVPRTYVNVGNTQYVTDSRLSVGGGGMSGPSLLKRTKEMVSLICDVGVPIVATGGVRTRDDVAYFLEQGVVMVGMATALVQNPFCVPKINQSLARGRHNV